MRLFEIMDDLISLYRGMSLDEFNQLQKTGIYTPNIHNPHNDATSDLETARYYASTKVHDEEGVIIQFTTSPSNVEQDTVYKGDYKIIKPLRLTNYRIV